MQEYPLDVCRNASPRRFSHNVPTQSPHKKPRLRCRGFAPLPSAPHLPMRKHPFQKPMGKKTGADCKNQPHPAVYSLPHANAGAKSSRKAKYKAQHNALFLPFPKCNSVPNRQSDECLTVGRLHINQEMLIRKNFARQGERVRVRGSRRFLWRPERATDNAELRN